tara:strand:- start:925 stop:1578 length:654 start_codon:yes stop_codon:yes gene_type:complete
MSELLNDDAVEETAEENTEEAVVEETEAVEGEETKVLLSGDGDDGADDAVPEAYEYTPPEGSPEVSEAVQVRLDAFSEQARDMNLSQAQYQALVELDTSRALASMEEGMAQYTDRINGWADETKADTELGGEDLARNLSVAKLGMDTYGTPELLSLLAAPSEENPDGLGLGNHPEVIRLFHRVGATLKESELIEGDTTVQGETGLKKMYPSMFQEAS